MHEVRPGVFLVDTDQRSDVVDALRSGARAILPSSASESDIATAARASVSGLIVLHPAVARTLSGGRPGSDAPDTTPVHLTRRELEVLRLLADGLGNKHIAGRLGISDHTVKAHLGALFEKLGASTRTEAVVAGARLGLVAV